MWSWFSKAADSVNIGSEADSPAIDLSLDELLGSNDTMQRDLQRGGVAHGNLPGDLRGRKRGTGLELDSIGRYQPGDDVRHIDWLATARTGQPHVKRFRLEIQRTIVLIVDLRPTMFFGSLKNLMAKNACLAAATHAQSAPWHQTLGWTTISNSAPHIHAPVRGRPARLQQLASIVDDYRNALANAADSTCTLAESIHGLADSIPTDCEVVLFSDFSSLGDDLALRLREFRSQRVHAIVVEDALMRQSPLPGRYPASFHAVVDTNENGGSSDRDSAPSVIPINNSANKSYEVYAQQSWRELTAQLKDAGVIDVYRY